MDWKNKLYFGDNLGILREHVATESVDLIYLDPPFNSNASYNVLFSRVIGSRGTGSVPWVFGCRNDKRPTAERRCCGYQLLPEDSCDVVGKIRWIDHMLSPYQEPLAMGDAVAVEQLDSECVWINSNASTVK